MWYSPKNTRQLLETIVIVMVMEMIVMLLLPILAPQVEGMGEAILDAVLLSLLAGPCLFFLYRARTSTGIKTEPALGGEDALSADFKPSAGNRRVLIPVTATILAVGLAMSLGVGSLIAEQKRETVESELQSVTEQASLALYDWAYRPVYGMKGARGLFLASEEVNRDEFRAYVKSRNLETEFPGTKVFGMITHARGSDGTGGGSEWLVQYAEPAAAGESLIGLDLSMVMSLREELYHAVYSGEPVLTEMINLPGIDAMQNSMLWLLPVYKLGHDLTDLTDPQDRVEALEGVLFTTFDPSGLQSVISRMVGRFGYYTVTDRESNGAPLLTNVDPDIELTPLGDLNSVSRILRDHSVDLRIGGREWTVKIIPTTSFAMSIDQMQSVVIAVIGSMLSIAAAALVWLLGSSRTRAIEMAHRMTEKIRHLSLVAEKTSNAVVITDPDQQIQWVNAAFTRMTGYTHDEVIGRMPGKLLRSDRTDPTTVKKIRSALSAGRGFRGEILNRAKNGREYWLDLDIQPVYDEQRKITSYIAVETELTAQKENETQLRSAMAKAEAANEAKGRFLASMSHEIRTPLNGIIGFADLLQRGADNGDEESRAEWIGVIHGSGKHLLSLLNDVLDLSKLDGDHTDIAVHPCNPRKAISEAVMLLNSRAREQGISLRITIDDDVPCAMRTDETRIRQIVMNVVSNAVKFTRQGGVEVHVSLSRESITPQLCIRVSDTGIGMTEEQIGRLFAPFQQADKTIGVRFGGTGLGLSISKRLAERLGGDITVTSTPDVGSVFSVMIDAIPLLPGEFVASENDTRAGWGLEENDSAYPLEGSRVLVADDVEANRKVCSLFLSKAGAGVVTVNDGSQAVEACKGAQFDLILMDVQMPVMNGLDASKQIRDMGITTPILALTAFSSGGDRVGCLASGMNDFLSKPIDSSLLIQASTRWIRKGKALGYVSTDTSGVGEDEHWDADLIEVAQDWLDHLKEKIDSAEEALSGEDLEPIARIGHMILGSGGTLGMPEFNQPSASLEKAALVGNREMVRAHLDDIKRVREEAMERIRRMSAA